MVVRTQTRRAKIFFAHVCGYTPVNALPGKNARKYNGNNLVTAPSAGRILRPNGRANDAARACGGVADGCRVVRRNTLHCNVARVCRTLPQLVVD